MKRKILFRTLSQLVLAIAIAMSYGKSIAHAVAVDQNPQLSAVETYLNGIQTVQSAFMQTSSTGATSSGELYMWRPGRLRVDYAPPTPILVVANRHFLIYYDRALEQVSYIPLSSTPAGILLQPELSLSDPKISITNFVTTPSLLKLTLTKANDSGDGSLTLLFATDPMSLSGWEVTDAQGVVTRVTLLNPQFGVHLSKSLFEFDDPRPPERHDP